MKTKQLKVDLNPPTVPFRVLMDGEPFLWNGALWIAYRHGVRTDKGEWANMNGLCISGEGGYLWQLFENESQVTPCQVDIKVTRVG